MTQNTTNSAILIRPNVNGMPVDLTNRSTDLFNFLRDAGRIRPWEGSTPQVRALTVTGNASAQYMVEGQPAPTPGRRSFASVSWSPWGASASGAVTGALRDLVKNGGTFENVLDAEMTDAIKSLLFFIEGVLTGSVQNQGLASLVDATDVCAGLDPATQPLWASYETAVGGAALSLTHLSDMYQSITGASRQGLPGVYLCNTNQLVNYGKLQGPQATAGIMRMGPPGQGVYDLGLQKAGFAYNGAPLVGIRSLPASEVYAMDLSDEDFALNVLRDIETRIMGVRGDDDEFMVSMRMGMQVGTRKVHGKVTGIAA